MDKFLEFWGIFKKNWPVISGVAIVVLFAVACVPLFINCAFNTPASCDFFAMDWDAADALAYYSNALGFIGTVVLGAITVYQTRKAHKQTKKANQLAKDALAQTQRANELAAKMQKLEEARFLSMVSVENVRFKIVKFADASVKKTPFMFPHTQKVSLIDFTNGSNPPEYIVIDTIIQNSSDFHIGTLSAVANYLSSTWSIDPKRNGIAPNKQMKARILIPCINRKSTGEYRLQIHLYFTNIFEYTTHLTLAIKDITNADGKYSYNYDIKKET